MVRAWRDTGMMAMTTVMAMVMVMTMVTVTSMNGRDDPSHIFYI